jgi:hypothetical protein
MGENLDNITLIPKLWDSSSCRAALPDKPPGETSPLRSNAVSNPKKARLFASISQRELFSKATV